MRWAIMMKYRIGQGIYAEVYQAILAEAVKRNAWGCSIASLNEYIALNTGRLRCTPLTGQ